MGVHERLTMCRGRRLSDLEAAACGLGPGDLVRPRNGKESRVHRRSWASIAMLAVGAGLLVAAGFAGPADSSPSSATAASKELRRGGTIRINIPGGDIDHIDPSLAYGTSTWAMQFSTALKLLNYPDAPAPR